jgi:hypothetical protein
MKCSRRAALALLLLSVSGCSLFGRHHREITSGAEAPPPARMGWREIATSTDRARIAKWRDGWTSALTKARQGGYASQIAAQGSLMVPDAALPDPMPPTGDYRCRVTKLGAQGPGGLDYITYPAFTCRISMEKDLLSFTKLDGSQRPCGLLFPNDDARMIFLGSMMLGDETTALEYGRDPDRDMVGAFERVGPKRWRLVLPWPRWESTLDVIELVPLG